MNQRLQQFLAAENMTQSELADTIKVARASVSHILAGRNKPGYDFIVSMMRHYPDLNMEWLLTGQGKMYKSSRDKETAGLHNEQQSPDMFFNGHLFQDDVPPAASQMSITPQESHIQSSDDTVHAKKRPSQCLEYDELPQKPVNQRKAVKVIIFFDDGSFQELRQ